MNRRAVVGMICALLSAVPASAQDSFDAWITARIESLVQERNVDANSQGSHRQREAPSAVGRSTSLVDQSAASDFISVAFSLIPNPDTPPTLANTNETPPGSGSVTVSLYSLSAIFSGRSLTDPAFYAEHTRARGVYFTVGTSASELESDGTGKKATVVGVKYLLVNQRDLFSGSNAARLERIQRLVSDNAVIEASLRPRIQTIISDRNGFASLQEFLLSGQPFGAQWPLYRDALNDEALEEIDGAIRGQLDSFQELQALIDETYDQIRQGRQLAIAFNSNQRPDDGTDEYRLSLNYDHGLSQRTSWTVNASFEFANRFGARDSRGGRLATELVTDLTGPENALWGRGPVTLSFAAAGEWKSATGPVYAYQAKLSVPVSTGLELPIVYRQTNRPGSIGGSDSEFRTGLTIDVGRIGQLFRDNSAQP